MMIGKDRAGVRGQPCHSAGITSAPATAAVLTCSRGDAGVHAAAAPVMAAS